MQNKTTYLNAYQPPVFEVSSVALDIELYDEYTIVTNQMHLLRQHPGIVTLLGDSLELIELRLNGDVLLPDAYVFEGHALHIECTRSLDSCCVTIVTRLKPQENTALSGLYRSKDLFCTQCEAEGFRRITYFPDRPDVLAIYTTRISADKARFPILLSNGNLQDTGDLPDGRHWVSWHDPFKKPSYLFALVAGKLAVVTDEFVTCSGKCVALQIYVEPGNEDKCGHAMTSLKHSMRWDEEQYGREYDLDLFMIVAVSDFNMGAMENKGLNIFNARYILARPDTATDEDYANIEAVVAHEYFHNWTGNRVTCRDWFQLSLKEGLTVFRDQEFSRDMNSRDVNRIQDVRVLRQAQFPEDAGRMAHPVRPASYQEINNFYTATIYNKGAEVIRMQETLVGKAGFRRGMDLYFERHDGQAVTVEDFVAAMSNANQIDLSQFMHWYLQPGTPKVTVESETYANGCLTLVLSQSCLMTPDGLVKEPFVIPIRIALFHASGEPMPSKISLLILKETTQTFLIEELSAAPLVSLLQDFSAPIRLAREVPEATCLTLFRHETNGFSKWDMGLQLVQKAISTCYSEKETSGWKINPHLLKNLHEVLCDEALDGSLRAELIIPPGFDIVAGQLECVDVDQLEKARDFYRLTLADTLWQDAITIYQQLWPREDHAMHGPAYTRRRLRNLCLWLMMKSSRAAEIQHFCENQFSQAKTMTDQLASFTLLAHSKDEAARLQAIERFYQQWQSDSLVLDKWFSVQAMSVLPGALQRVEALTKHPSFTMKNPNKVRALIGAFSQMNPRHFYARDGSGYAFLTETLLELDSINPSIAARLAQPFTRWQLVDKGRQVQILQQLEYLSAKNLSADLRELVSKSLP